MEQERDQGLVLGEAGLPRGLGGCRLERSDWAPFVFLCASIAALPLGVDLIRFVPWAPQDPRGQMCAVLLGWSVLVVGVLRMLERRSKGRTGRFEFGPEGIWVTFVVGGSPTRIAWDSVLSYDDRDSGTVALASSSESPHLASIVVGVKAASDRARLLALLEERGVRRSEAGAFRLRGGEAS